MRVNTKVHESMVDRVTPGLKARIRVDAFASRELIGTVQLVNPLPDPSSFLSSDIKVYTTMISIDNGFSELRPGMTAQVEILVTQLDNVLSVPVQAILRVQGQGLRLHPAAEGELPPERGQAGHLERQAHRGQGRNQRGR